MMKTHLILSIISILLLITGCKKRPCLFKEYDVSFFNDSLIKLHDISSCTLYQSTKSKDSVFAIFHFDSLGRIRKTIKYNTYISDSHNVTTTIYYLVNSKKISKFTEVDMFYASEYLLDLDSQKIIDGRLTIHERDTIAIFKDYEHKTVQKSFYKGDLKMEEITLKNLDEIDSIYIQKGPYGSLGTFSTYEYNRCGFVEKVVVFNSDSNAVGYQEIKTGAHQNTIQYSKDVLFDTVRVVRRFSYDKYGQIVNERFTFPVENKEINSQYSKNKIGLNEKRITETIFQNKKSLFGTIYYEYK